MTARTSGTLVSETVAPAALPVVGRARKRGGPWLGIASTVVYLFLYLPLFVVILYSFSATRVNAWPIKGYTLDWYRELMVDDDIHDSIRLSITVGLIAAAIAVVLGTLTAFALDRYDFPGKPAIRFFVVLPIINPSLRETYAPAFIVQHLVYGAVTGLLYTWLRPQPYNPYG